jgi:hypothetical protein
MRTRLAAVGLGLILGSNGAGAQPLPSSQLPQSPLGTQLPGSVLPGAVFPGANLPGAAGGFPVAPAPTQAPGLLPQGLLPKSSGAINPGTPTPGAASPGAAAGTPGAPAAGLPAEFPLPQPEQKVALSAMDVQVKRVMTGWEVWVGQRQLRTFGDNETGARDVARVFRDLHPTEWVTIGGPKPVIEYGLVNGRPAVAGAAPASANEAASQNGSQNGNTVQNAGGFGAAMLGAGAKLVQPIDLRSARTEAIRGAWCVRDDDNILFNFGPDRADAEQATAVIRKYGFNRVGVVGTPAQPAMSYLFVSLEQDRPKALPGSALVNAQIDAMTRTGIPLPGAGFVGEMVKIDPRKVEARREGTEWVVAAGAEVLGHFGPTEWAAREAAHTVRDSNFTEFCKLGGTSNLTFFLRDGKAPSRAPLSAQGRAFDPTTLKVQQINGKWAVTEGNRHLLNVGSPQEGENVVRVLKAYGFDQLAHLSAAGPNGGVTFLVKNR